MKGHNYGNKICLKCGKIHEHPKPMLGKIVWNKGLTKDTDARILQYSEKFKGENNPSKRQEIREKISRSMKGKHWKLSEETKKKMSLSKMGDKNPAKKPDVREKLREKTLEYIMEFGSPMKGKIHSEETKLKIKLNHWSRKGYKPWNKGVKQWEFKRHPMLGKKHSKETKEKLSTTMKHLWKNPELREKFIKCALKGLRKRPTSFEGKIICLINENNLPFEYVGDGKVIIGFRNPDFIHSGGKKLLIETYFSLFHQKNYEYTRSKFFSRYGFKSLFLNETDLMAEKWKDICLEKIKNFIGENHSS